MFHHSVICSPNTDPQWAESTRMRRKHQQDLASDILTHAPGAASINYTGNALKESTTGTAYRETTQVVTQLLITNPGITITPNRTWQSTTLKQGLTTWYGDEKLGHIPTPLTASP
ncbi:unnamed protein product [Cuscuta europaea]|uniref:Uncharacterized protein n=1 Tax=Cuscuta europaea TaxID=41803 RepID=A0A9P1E9K4_CUSEU|nr:unnamed protein product [Cuscuta europaea]